MTINGANVKVALFLDEVCETVHTAYSCLMMEQLSHNTYNGLKNCGWYMFGDKPYYSSFYYREDVMTDSEAIELFKANLKVRFG